ncbi:DUF1549 domain-containing protein [Tuwongella immobilis]|uniref:BIG2 domain-containing protein n=1 Tax=Tuwongella immobilis TaxID=692036 RepID=A0A6C2YMX9_9BACT|nr:DUF1549 domain-containing protein [Tuwongella immobilis]VIP02569.1 Ig-like domain-containing protein OS=Singulisphaera acidiphila (strain ATCC BAA-1392 / DSM 18658 / VKM B-2454 / MOB10) GN=Sinac_3078 PE=4 SV=1: Big_2: Big_2: PSCyt2: PSD1 [Tuwongella immobilis]VTS01796.1 Ig-like domain-containing protein OS=Singulisphaera acidiphila (strain ATCC BAA-1392 / DSM 18658 / VKM B-2454 / MOB10) GN=Sinac_3078 PE=4 SV=1: Big_2: Big_2: PSCyt2: PSD1 [Tuwongella immobilis]
MHVSQPPFLRSRWVLAGCLLLLITPASRAEFRVEPASVQLRDAFDGRQLLVFGGQSDLTRQAQYQSQSPAIATIDATGYITPHADGTTDIRVTAAGETKVVRVTVSGVGSSRAIDFKTEIVPILSKTGCNAGGCHGKASGQNGFRLSLFGFDAEFDHAAITKEARGRRIFPASPESSLLIVKATAKVPHGGGKRLQEQTDEYRRLLQWIAAGAPAAAPDAAVVTRIRVIPEDRVLQDQQQQQLAVLADYSDGTTRDVTRQAEYQSNLDVVASVDKEGLIQARAQSGEAAIMARYMGYVAVCRAMVPHGEPLQSLPNWQPVNRIDELAAKKWMKLGLQPSPPCDDATFLRRVTLDLAGRLPHAEEVTQFLADTQPNKRALAIDRLLESPDYAAFFAMRWGSILRNSNLAGSERASYAFHNWLKDQIARNVPYDQFVRGLVAASGEWQDAPAINWFWQNRDDQLHQTTADVAQVFLGVRLQCAKCHHHPYERWGQAEYYGLAGFFTRLGRKSFGEPPPYFTAANVTTGELNPLTGKTPEPRFLDGIEPKFGPADDPRHALVDWMAKPDNPFFAKALVNRYWGHFFGRGLVHEVDDLRETNPPSNPELLDFLATEFVRSKCDVKAMIRLMLNSRVYQLSSDPIDANRKDRQNFARFYARRMIAEVFLDSVNSATGVKERFNNMSLNARAVDLPHENFGSYFLDTFDRPRRVTTCDCERSTGATLAQVLLLANSEDMENKLHSDQGRIAKALKAKKPVREIIDELYLQSVSRLPTDRERQRIERFVGQSPDPAAAFADVLWTLVNSKEFMFNH